MALTTDVHTIEYGVPDGGEAQLVAYPVASGAQLYSGAVALLSGGTGATKGYLKNGNLSVSATDVVVGVIGEPAGGTFVATGPGIKGGATDGAVWVNVRTGAFFLQSASGADQLSATTNAATVYYAGENNSGGLAAATSASSTRPVLGVQLPQDPGIAGTVTPGAGYWPISLNGGL
jgi:hypothetical protein